MTWKLLIKYFFIYALAFVSAIAISLGLVYFLKADPIVAIKGAVETLGTLHGSTEVLTRMAPILLVGLAVTVAFRCKVINLGAEGQFWMGAIAATGLGLNLSLNPVLFIPLIFLASFMAGGLWAAIPGLLKAKYGVNEMVFTLMMTFIAIEFGTWLFEYPWRDITASHSQTPLINSSAWLPRLIPGTRLHAGVFLIPMSILFVYGLLWKTPLGYNIRAVGISAKAAEYAGINPKKNIVLSMFISGGLAGTAGMIEITGVFRLMIEGISLGYGFYAITAGLLGKLNPFGVALAALLLSTISVGADTMQRTVGAPVYLVFVIQSLVLLFVILAEYVVRRSVD